MKPREIFNQISINDTSNEYRENINSYWDIELNIAFIHNISYTYICDYQDEDDRRCAICDTPCHTNEKGRLSAICLNDRCQTIRDYFQLKGGVDYLNMSGMNKTIRNYLRVRIKEIYNKTRLYDIPKENRFVFLLNVMLERMAYESTKNH